MTKRPRLKTLALGAAAFIAFAAALAFEIEHRRYPQDFAGLTPLRMPLVQIGNLRGSFKAVWSEPHYVAIVFPENTDLHTGAEPQKARSAQDDTLDLEWRVLDAAVEVARGAGPKESTPSRVLGTPALALGEFAARAGHTYSIELRLGPRFERFLRSAPAIQVGVNSPGPSLGLPWVQQFARPVAGICAIVGLVLFAWAAFSARERAG